MQIQLTDAPFSYPGSYISFNYLAGHQLTDEVMLRTVRGGTIRQELLCIIPGNRPPQCYGATFTPTELTIPSADGAITIRFKNPTTMLLTTDTPVTLHQVQPSDFDGFIQLTDSAFVCRSHSAETILNLRVVTGHADLAPITNNDATAAPSLCLAADTVMEIEERLDSPVDTRLQAISFPGGSEWLEGMPAAPQKWARARELAAYVNWSALVAPSGHLRVPTMLMSKNWMNRIWSWDHCFNALSLTVFPDLAWAQFRGIFDHQSPHGNLPDCMDDRLRSYSFVKPPVHGWTLDILWREGVVTPDQLRDVFAPLERWTDWWLSERIAPGRRLPHYFHGNDSGWDNSTVFATGVPVESPDLAAHLVLQCDVLGRIAANLGYTTEAERWQNRADGLLASLLDELWTGDRFIARHARTGEEIDTESLLLLIPIVLGQRLPVDIFTKLVLRLEEQAFVTEHGLATEAITSERYEPDGYWRGPIWAPSTYLIVEGLRRGNQPALASSLAERFCRMVSESGAGENFDALTGVANRDRAYTWTSSIFLLLAASH